MITIVDYGAGNLRSVANAIEALGRQAQVVEDARGLRGASAIILPGVGAFGDGMEGLRKRDLVDVLTEEVVGKGKPFLGICLGMQVLATEGLENGRHLGLGWIPGTVRRIEPAEKRFKVPHMGWNDVQSERPSRLLEGLPEAPVFYFVHSYYFDPAPDSVDTVTATAWHGAKVPAVIERGHVFGVQFHPEKSQRAGLKVLENFLSAAGI